LQLEAVDFGKYLREIRTAKKMTIRQLELYSGVSNAYISQIERGERGVPSPDILKKIAGPLGVEYADLMEKAGYLDSEVKVEKELDDPIVVMADIVKNQKYANSKEIKDLKGEMRELMEIVGFEDLFKTIDLSDEELLMKYIFVYRGKKVSEDKVKKILSFIRFVAQEED
jgi:transcriptional regulator with XRE-family HTH domain